MKARDAISEATGDDLENSFDRALVELSSFDTFSDDELRRYLCGVFYPESDDEWAHHELQSAKRDFLIDEIDGFDVTPTHVARWLKKDNVRKKEVQRVYDVYTSLAPDVDMELLSAWIPEIRKYLKKDVLRVTRKELIDAMDKAGYFGSKSDSARHNADKYF